MWLAAGVNILRIGILAATGFREQDKTWQNLLMLFLAAVIFICFSFMFYKIVTKHEKRILGYEEEKKSVFCFFDLKGYLMMLLMMGLGLSLRRGSFLPDFFFAFFYTGLGAALSASGFRFIARFFKLRVRQIVWICVGLLTVVLGTLGIFLPILPTVPLYLLASFSFLSSSQKLYDLFCASRLYKKNLLPYLEAGGLPRRIKLPLILFVSLQIGIAAFLLRGSIVGLVILGVIFCGFLSSMLFAVKTVPYRKK